jgi:hypothetical protein
MVELLASWSSPLRTTTAPCRLVPREVAVLEGVAAAIDARPLPVPEGHHAIHAGMRVVVEHLGAADRGRRQLLVGAGHMEDVVLVEDRLGPGQGEVVAGQG